MTMFSIGRHLHRCATGALACLRSFSSIIISAS